MTLTNEDLLARFTVEHFDRNSVGADRRYRVLRELRGVAATLGTRTLVEMTPSDLMAWQGAELKRGIAPNTVAEREWMVRSFVNWATRAGVMSAALADQLKSLPAVRGAQSGMKPKPYRREELERFREELAARFPLAPVDGTPGRGKYTLRRFLRSGTQGAWESMIRSHARRLQLEAQVSLALEEGLRRVEVFGIPLAAIEPTAEGVVVRSAKSRPGEERWRTVPWTAHSRLVVGEWLDFRRFIGPDHDHPWLMLRVQDRSSPLPWATFRHALDQAKMHGSQSWPWHRFRHTFATERLRAGVPLEKLQKMMGHAKLEQTLAYAEIVNADVQAEAERTEAAFAEALGLVAA